MNKCFYSHYNGGGVKLGILMTNAQQLYLYIDAPGIRIYAVYLISMNC